MKKIILIISLLILILSIPVIIRRFIPIKPFYLNDEYYENTEIKEITIEELETLTENKVSFGLFIYQPMCLVSASFNKILEEFTINNQLKFYKIPFSEIKNTNLNKKITYYPSFVLYKEGKVKVYLDANKNEDLEYFSSLNGFETWFNKYILLKDVEKNNNYEADSPINEEVNNNNNILLEDVTKEEGKVNIYFFWGNGCPHCKEEFKFLSEIEEEYKNMFNLYTYETWYNEENVEIAKSFANALDEEIEGVPFTIIGTKVFSGFGESTKEAIKNAIETESKNDFDVYFDKIINAN